MRTILITLFSLLSCATCFGQSSFLELTPGTSTRGEVNRALGPPTNTYNAITADHAPPAGIQKVKVVYGVIQGVIEKQDSDVVDEIEIDLPKPISRAALIKKFGLPQQPDLKKTFDDGSLEEFFGGEALLILIYESAGTDSGVKRICYDRKEMFEAYLRQHTRNIDVPLLNASVTAIRFYSEDAQGTAFKDIVKRVYGIRFPKDQTARIAWELEFRYPAPGRTIPFTVEANFYDLQGTRLGKGTVSCHIEASWTVSTCHGAQGWDTPGKWPIRVYRVEFLINGQKAASGSFEVY